LGYPAAHLMSCEKGHATIVVTAVNERAAIQQIDSRILQCNPMTSVGQRVFRFS